MTAVTLIFPHQLFADHPCIEKDRGVYLIEEVLFFKQYNFHQQKLVLHRISMKKYARYLAELNITVNYIEMAEAVTPNFVNTLDGVKPFFDKKKSYFQTAVYIDQHKQLAILVDAGEKKLVEQ